MTSKIILADSQQWLKKCRDKSIPNVITGICDMNETNMDLSSYLTFFENIANLIFSKQNPNGYCIFIQTDRKYNKTWIDKSFILTKIAYKYGFKMIWHKIILHRNVNSTDLHRPTYAHMLCYSINGTTGSAFPDVLPVSKKIYKNGTPTSACEHAVRFIKQYNKFDTTVLDPFVGQGTIPAIANKHGVNAIGIDIDQKQVEIARKNVVSN